MTHQESWLHRVWTGWRREIIRGAVLFGVVVTVGLFIAAQVRAFNPLALMRNGGFDFDFSDHGARHWVDAGRFAGSLKAGETLWLRNLNGQITVERASGDSFEVVAEKSWRHSDPQSVEVTMVPGSGSATVCALWPARESTCGPDGHFKVSGSRGRNDVMVRFVVRLPDAVRLDASTVNGAVEAHGVASPLNLETVNGAIRFETETGPVSATTVNGSIAAAISRLAVGNEVQLTTVNGSITAAVPASINAALEATTVNGRISSSFPLQVVGKLSPRHVRATIGSGGTPLILKTVNGSVTIEDLSTAPVVPEVAPVPPTPPVPAVAPSRPRARAVERGVAP